jgi:hypothetical protein
MTDREFVCQQCKREDCWGVLNTIFCNNERED